MSYVLILLSTKFPVNPREGHLIWLKACPRCRGDLFREFWPGLIEMVCLQCGFSPNDEQEREIAAAVRRVGAFISRPRFSIAEISGWSWRSLYERLCRWPATAAGSTALDGELRDPAHPETDSEPVAKERRSVARRPRQAERRGYARES